MEQFTKWLMRYNIFDAASRATVIEFMWNIEVIMGKAYTPHVIQSSYRVTGAAPFDALRICEHYPNGGRLTERKGMQF